MEVFEHDSLLFSSEIQTTATSQPPSIPLFLKPGSSYQGKTASTRIANVASTVAVLGK